MSKLGAILFVGSIVCGTACVSDTMDGDPTGTDATADEACAIPIVLHGEGRSHGPVFVPAIANCESGNVTLDGETVGNVTLAPGDVLEAIPDPSRPKFIRTDGLITPPLNVGLGCATGGSPITVTFRPGGNIGGPGSFGNVIIPSACGANRVVQLGGGGVGTPSPDDHGEHTD